MTRREIRILHYMTPIDNLGSILQHGILSHKRCASLRVRDVSNSDVQARRAQRAVPSGKPLHEYTNVYFNGRNAMLFTVLHECREMVLLGVSPSILDLDGVVITDGNAASGQTRFLSPNEGIAILNAEEVMAVWWNDPNQIERERRKWRMQAEVLVPNKIGVEFIRGAFVPTLAHERILNERWPQLRTKVDRELFFGDKFFSEGT